MKYLFAWVLFSFTREVKKMMMMNPSFCVTAKLIQGLFSIVVMWLIDSVLVSISISEDAIVNQLGLPRVCYLSVIGHGHLV